MAIDLSKLSTEDLQALQNNDVSKISTDGLKYLSSSMKEGDSAAPSPSSSPSITDKLGKIDPLKLMMGEGIWYSPEEASAARTGAIESLTLGASPKIGAAGDVLGDVLSGNQGLSGLGSKWQQYRKAREQANAKEAEQFPTAHLVGNIAGGIAGVPLIPELGGAKLAGYIPKAAENAGLIAKGASALGKGFAGMVPLGGVMGALGSESDTLGGVAADTASSALTGGLGGGALSLAGSAIGSGVNKLLNKKDSGDYAKAAYDLGQQGLKFGDKESQDTMAGLSNKYSEDFVKGVKFANDDLGSAVQDSLQTAAKNGVKVNADPEITQSIQKAVDIFKNDPALLHTLDNQTAQWLNNLNTKGFGDLSPVEAKALKDMFYNQANKLANNTSPMAGAAIAQSKNAADALNMALKKAVPEYETAANNYTNFHNWITEHIINKGVSPDIAKTFYNDFDNPSQKLYSSVKDMLMSGRLGGTDASEARMTLKGLSDQLNKLEANNPTALANLTGGKSAEEFYNDLYNKSNTLAALRQAEGRNPAQAPSILSGTMGGISKLLTGSKSLDVGVANMAGDLSQSLPVRASQKLFSATNDGLFNLAQQLKKSSASSFYGNALEKALLNKNETAKNAVLFKLMQIPEYRQMFVDKEPSSSDTMMTTPESNP